MNNSGTPRLADTVPVWARIGLLSFGGPAAQIALMHREIVEDRGWLSEEQFLRAVSFCMLLPGPEAMQIATYAGWRLNGTIGGILAGLLFVLPGACVIFALALLYTGFGHLDVVQTAFLGVQAAVIGIVVKALWGLAGRALVSAVHWALAAFGFVALFVFDVPFPLVIACAAVAGLVFRPAQESARGPARPSPTGTFRTIAIWCGLWMAPVLLLWLWDPGGLLLQVGLFFSRLAVVTFGGAYAVLAYMAQEVVSGFGWLSAAQMMDGLGLAETTPGPLILVTQFVGFLAGVGQGGLWLGIAAGLLTLWVTFVPCFLWIFVAAPYVDWLTGLPRINAALKGITAAVVGVILNLSLWFALHVIFADVARWGFGGLKLWLPNLASLDVMALVLSCLAIFLVVRVKIPLPLLLVLCAGGALTWSALIAA